MSGCGLRKTLSVGDFERAKQVIQDVRLDRYPEWMSQVADGGTDAMIALLIAQLPNLEHLVIGFNFRVRFHLHRQITCALLRRSIAVSLTGKPGHLHTVLQHIECATEVDSNMDTDGEDATSILDFRFLCDTNWNHRSDDAVFLPLLF